MLVMAVQLGVGAGHVALTCVHRKAIGLPPFGPSNRRAKRRSEPPVACTGTTAASGKNSLVVFTIASHRGPSVGECVAGSVMRCSISTSSAKSPNASRKKTSRSSWVWPGNGRISISSQACDGNTLIAPPARKTVCAMVVWENAWA